MSFAKQVLIRVAVAIPTGVLTGVLPRSVSKWAGGFIIGGVFTAVWIWTSPRPKPGPDPPHDNSVERR